MRDLIVETLLAAAILIWGISESLVTWVNVDQPPQHDHAPRSVDGDEAALGH